MLSTDDLSLDRLRHSIAAFALAVAAVLAPFWNAEIVHLPIGILTVGRAMGMACVLGLAIDLGRGTVDLRSMSRLGWLLLAAGGLFGAVVAVNSYTEGCHCGTSLVGYLELAPMLIAAVLVLARRPETAWALLLACVGGSMVAALTAIGGVGAVGPAAQVGAGRLAGTFGNANELGYIVAFAIPVAIVLGREGQRRVQGFAALVCAIASLVLVLSYSRGSFISAAAGGLATFALLSIRSRPAALRLVGAAVAAAAAAAMVYPLFLDARIDASFSAPAQSLAARDLTGWDGAALGLPATAPSRLDNPAAGTLRIRSRRSGQGVSFPLGARRAGAEIRVSFRARSDGDPLPFAYGFKGAAAGQAAVSRTDVLTGRARRFELTWRTPRRAPDAGLYFWQAGGAAGFSLEDVRLRSRDGATAVRERTLPWRLRGSARSRAIRIGQREEARYLDTRVEAAKLAVRQFVDHPVTGIGWDRFPGVAARELQYGPLATHNEYLRIAAELGVPGLLALLAGITVVLLGVWRDPRSHERAAATGILVTAAVGQVFANGIVFAEASIPAVIAAALVCSPRAGRSSPDLV